MAIVAVARDSMGRARAPFSGFRVGAALRTAGGSVYTGCNVENPSVMLTVCAERVALLKALSQGATSFTAIAIVASDGRSCPPCGVCRQMLAEFAPGISVFLGADDGIRRYEIGDLLPYPFERP